MFILTNMDKFKIDVYVQHERQCSIILPNIKKRIKNTTSSGASLTNFEEFENAVKVKQIHSCLRFLFEISPQLLKIYPQYINFLNLI